GCDQQRCVRFARSTRADECDAALALGLARLLKREACHQSDTSTFTLKASPAASATVTPSTISPVSASTTGTPRVLSTGFRRFLIWVQSGDSLTLTSPAARYASMSLASSRAYWTCDART